VNKNVNKVLFYNCYSFNVFLDTTRERENSEMLTTRYRLYRRRMV